MTVRVASSSAFITRQLRLIFFVVDHETMLGLKRSQAGHDVVAVKRKNVKKEVKSETEEWRGFGDQADPNEGAPDV